MVHRAAHCAATIKDPSTSLTYTIISAFDNVVIYPYSFFELYDGKASAVGGHLQSSFNKLIKYLSFF